MFFLPVGVLLIFFAPLPFRNTFRNFDVVKGRNVAGTEGRAGGGCEIRGGDGAPTRSYYLSKLSNPPHKNLDC